MVFDFDGDGSYTDENKARGRAVSDTIAAWLKWKGIPFYVFDHGGRSPHTWILFTLPDSALGGPDRHKIYHSERMRIASWVLKEAGINEKESGFDKKIFASGRHLIRVPKKDIPEKVQTWKISDEEYKAILGKSLESAKKKNDEPLKNEMYSQLSKAGYYFRDQHNEVFAAVEVGGHREIHPTKGRWFRSYATRLIYTTLEEVAGADALRSVIALVDADAFHDGQRIHLNNRCAFHDGALWYDLCNEKWQAIRIDANGWEIVDDPPILFRRYDHQQAQVCPDAEAGDAKLMLEHTNLKTDADKIMALASLCYAFIPDKPKPLVYPHGMHGAAKSTFCSVNKRLVDPSSAENINPKKIDDLPQHFAHHYLPVLDNVSYIGDELSDFLCRACTGMSGGKRALFTDDEDVLYSFTRQVYINGISLVAHKPDLLDRILPLEHEEIKPEKRKEANRFWSEFDRDKPRILGGIFTALSKALKSEKDLTLPKLQRMADFTRWGEAISRALGYPDNAFLKAYQDKVDASIAAAFESNPIAGLLMTFMESSEQKDKPEWIGTMSQLHSTLRGQVMLAGEDLKTFPKDAIRLSKKINEIRGELLKAEIQIDHEVLADRKRTRLIHIRNLSSVTSITSATGTGIQFNADDKADDKVLVSSANTPAGDNVNDKRTIEIVIPSDKNTNPATAPDDADVTDDKKPTLLHRGKKRRDFEAVINLVKANEDLGGETHTEDLWGLGADDATINKAKSDGYIYEPKPGIWRAGGRV